MLKFVQICASQNDLFGLDPDGIVYHYNFVTNGWKRLGQGRHDGAASSADDGGSPGGEDVAEGHGRPRSAGRSRTD